MAKKKKSVLHSHEAAKPSHNDAKSDINITPLIDVMLVLLIIFMVVTPLAQRGLDIALPQNAPPHAQDQPKPDNNQVVLDIQENGMFVNKGLVESMDALENRLKDIFQARVDKTMFVKASGKIPYGKVIQAMDIARGPGVGVEKIGIISEKQLADAGVAPNNP